MMDKRSICQSCFHSYVCEQFNDNKDYNNEKCHFFNDHYVPTADVAPKSEVDAMNKELRVTRQYIHDNGLEFDLLSKYDNISAKIDSFADIGKMYSEIKAEAIKEFAERLRDNLPLCKMMSDFVMRSVDKTLKEMIGEENEA